MMTILLLTSMSTPHHYAYSSCIHDEVLALFPLCLLHVVLSLSYNLLLSCCVGCLGSWCHGPVLQLGTNMVSEARTPASCKF